MINYSFVAEFLIKIKAFYMSFSNFFFTCSLTFSLKFNSSVPVLICPIAYNAGTKCGSAKVVTPKRQASSYERSFFSEQFDTNFMKIW